MPDIAVAIVAAGRGARAGGDAPKQFRLLGGKPVLRWSLETFAARDDVSRIIVAIPDGEEERFHAAASGLDADIRSISGGASRTASTRACLEALYADNTPDIVLIHDAARPFVSDELIDRLIAALADHDGAAPALRPDDALKGLSENGALGGDIDRDGVRAVQTPQAFRFRELLNAFRTLPPDADLPDEVAVFARARRVTFGVPGEARNFKLTHPDDFARAEALLADTIAAAAPSPGMTTTGSGFDAHRLVGGDKLYLCGVEIEGALTLSGHSDADVGLHAVTDALLGAIGEGDIGQHFPPSDPQWKGAASSQFVRHAMKLARGAGARVIHADVTLICERPRIGPHRDAMRAALAQLLEIEPRFANIKATTTEGMGFAGRSEGIAAQAVVTVRWA